MICCYNLKTRPIHGIMTVNDSLITLTMGRIEDVERNIVLVNSYEVQSL